MTRLLAVSVSPVLVFLVAAAGSTRAEDRPATEKEKIEALIRHVEEMKGAKFIRNGREYDARTAVRLMRGKWDANEAKIKTARDFIEMAASISSTTGKPYMIRLGDGKEVKSRDYLLTVLEKLEKSPDGKPRP